MYIEGLGYEVFPEPETFGNEVDSAAHLLIRSEENVEIPEELFEEFVVNMEDIPGNRKFIQLIYKL